MGERLVVKVKFCQQKTLHAVVAWSDGYDYSVEFNFVEYRRRSLQYIGKLMFYSLARYLECGDALLFYLLFTS